MHVYINRVEMTQCSQFTVQSLMSLLRNSYYSALSSWATTGLFRSMFVKGLILYVYRNQDPGKAEVRPLTYHAMMTHVEFLK
jgi:hypothetical protein